jgi:hypothetical protein
MLWLVFISSLLLWLAGVVASYTMGGWIHLFLALAVITLTLQVMHRHRPAH